VGDERAAVSAGVGSTTIGAVWSNLAESGVCHAYMYTPVVSLGLEPAPAASERARRQETEFARSRQSIIAGDVAELCEESVALFGGCTREPAECVLGGWTRRQFAAADRKRPNQQKSLVIVCQLAHIISQQLERARVLVQTFSGGLRAAGQAVQGRMCQEVTNEGCAGRYRHGQPAFLAVACKKHSPATVRNLGIFPIVLICPLFPIKPECPPVVSPQISRTGGIGEPLHLPRRNHAYPPLLPVASLPQQTSLQREHR
jgi:hypothetical protein